MGLFESKASRIAKHRELIEFARSALTALKVEPFESKHDGFVPSWREPSIVPMEYWRWLNLHMETLVPHVYDPDLLKDLGDKGLMQELAEAVAYVRAYLAGVTPDIRDKFRAQTFSWVQKSLIEQVDRYSKAVALGKLDFLMTAEDLERWIRNGRTAVGWFGSPEELNRAVAAERIAQKGQELKPLPYLHVLKGAVADAEKLVLLLDEMEMMCAVKPSMRVSTDGTVAISGFGRNSLRLSREDLETLLSNADKIRTFIAENEDSLKTLASKL